MWVVLLVGCDDPAAPSDPVGGYGSVPGPPRGTLVTDLDARGTHEELWVASFLQLAPAEGEDCVPSLTGLLTSAAAFSTSVPLPVEVKVGAVVSLPPWPHPLDPVWNPPLFQVDDAFFAWVGGEYEVLEWTEDSFELALRGGFSCEFVDDHLVLEETCVPDSGFVRYSPEPNDAPIHFLDDIGAVGEGWTFPAPGGGYLCDRRTSPVVPTPTP
jgi:hypothetical protein